MNKNKHKLTFIFGAGTSLAYGFPLGKGLKKQILDLNSEEILETFLADQDTPFSKSTIDKMKKAISKFSTVDEAYQSTNHKDTKKLLEQLVIWEISDKENEETLLNPSKEEKPCYEELWSFIKNYLKITPTTPFLNELINISMFNYERSLAKFFQFKLMDFFDKKVETGEMSSEERNKEIEKIIKTFGFYHLHGTWAGLRNVYKTNNTTVYGKRPNPRSFYSLNFSLFPVDDLNEDFKACLKNLETIDRVILLGCGAHERNFRNLKLIDSNIKVDLFIQNSSEKEKYEILLAKNKNVNYIINSTIKKYLKDLLAELA